ncbi:hypothetical protein P3T23_000585 [Paraburkholderia sp. GAS448]
MDRHAATASGTARLAVYERHLAYLVISMIRHAPIDFGRALAAQRRIAQAVAWGLRADNVSRCNLCYRSRARDFNELAWGRTESANLLPVPA